jgi:hypothetical protein
LDAFEGGAEAGEPRNRGPNSKRTAMISNPAANIQILDLGTKGPSLSFASTLAKTGPQRPLRQCGVPGSLATR